MANVVRLSKESDLMLTELKHEALIKHEKNIYKNQIVDWLILNSFNTVNLKLKFSKWVKSL